MYRSCEDRCISEPRMGHGANVAILVRSFLVHVFERTRYKSERIVIGLTSIMLKVISFFLGVTILAKWRFVGHEQCPSRNPFHRVINCSSNTSGTHIRTGCVQPQHPGAVVVLVWRVACFRSVNWKRVFSDKLRHSGGTDSNILTTPGSISSSRFQNCHQSRKNALWSFTDQIQSIRT